MLEVVPGSMAEAAGVQVGDHRVRIGEIDASSEDFGARYRERYADLAEGSPMDIVVRRNNRDLVLPGRFRLVVQVERRLEFVEGASPKATRIRAGILHGTTGP